MTSCGSKAVFARTFAHRDSAKCRQKMLTIRTSETWHFCEVLWFSYLIFRFTNWQSHHVMWICCCVAFFNLLSFSDVWAKTMLSRFSIFLSVFRQYPFFCAAVGSFSCSTNSCTWKYRRVKELPADLVANPALRSCFLNIDLRVVTLRNDCTCEYQGSTAFADFDLQPLTKPPFASQL